MASEEEGNNGESRNSSMPVVDATLATARRQNSCPYVDMFPSANSASRRQQQASSLSASTSAMENLDSQSVAPAADDIRSSVDAATRFAFADLLITIIRLDFYRGSAERASRNFCDAALELILAWSALPEKTNATLRAHLHDAESSANEDIATLITAIRSDAYLVANGAILLMGGLLVAIIQHGEYDARYRVLLRHIAALLGTHWDMFEELEDSLSNRLLNDYVESEASKTARERSARLKKYKRYALISAAGAAGAVLIGVTGGLAAPLVATGVGAIVGGGAGAAAILGTLSTATGAAIFGSIFGAAGGGLAGYRMKKRVGAIEEFVVEPLTDAKSASLHCVLCVSGWIDENDDAAFRRPWRHLWMSKDQYSLRYEGHYLEEWGKAMEYFMTGVVTYAIQRSLMETALAGVISAIAWPLLLISSASIIDNPWNVCLSRTVEVGEHLAEILLTRAHGRRPITLIGFSLGARVIYHCLLAMSKRCGGKTAKDGDGTTNDASASCYGIVEDVVLLGAPVSASPAQWRRLCSVVGGRVINGYCTTDWLLRFLYRTASIQFTIAGTGPVDNRQERKIVNFNLSHIIKGHTEYSRKLTEALDAVGVRVTPLSKKSRRDLEQYLEEHKAADGADGNDDGNDDVLALDKADEVLAPADDHHHRRHHRDHSGDEAEEAERLRRELVGFSLGAGADGIEADDDAGVKTRTNHNEEERPL